jgi:hypothetical protein
VVGRIFEVVLFGLRPVAAKSPRTDLVNAHRPYLLGVVAISSNPIVADVGCKKFPVTIQRIRVRIGVSTFQCKRFPLTVAHLTWYVSVTPVLFLRENAALLLLEQSSHEVPICSL